jgi:hypothetical protein
VARTVNLPEHSMSLTPAAENSDEADIDLSALLSEANSLLSVLGDTTSTRDDVEKTVTPRN